MKDDDQQPQQDERGSEPPDEKGHDKAPQEGSEPEHDPVSSPGPQGNPASDEEALANRQQERDSPSDD